MPKSRNGRESGLFASLGLQTVDDLLDDADEMSEVSEVPTEVEEDTIPSASEHLSSQSSSRHGWQAVDSKVRQTGDLRSL